MTSVAHAVIFRLLLLGLVLGGAMTLLGFLAPIFAPADFINHFRPVTAFGFALLIIPALLLRRRTMVLCVCMFLIGNSLLLALPMLTKAEPASMTKGRPFSVLAFNLWLHKPRLDEAITWVARQDVDIVVLQEVQKARKGMIIAALSPHFPNVFDYHCNELLVLTKRTWIYGGGRGRSDSEPSMSWLVFDDGRGGTFRFVGLRTTYPMKSRQQARQYAWMSRQFAADREARPNEPLIISGDFNLTPWSWQLHAFARATGLKRHGTWATSWNAKSAIRPLWFLIDNVLASPDVRAHDFSTGPRLGSDHLPIIARLTLP